MTVTMVARMMTMTHHIFNGFEAHYASVKLLQISVRAGFRFPLIDPCFLDTTLARKGSREADATHPRIFSVSLQQILRHSRENSTKVIFLITDGYSNGGDPRPIAASLRDFGVEIFTFGIWQGNIRELNDMASTPKEEHCYLLHSFEEFEALARRALHEGNRSLLELQVP